MPRGFATLAAHRIVTRTRLLEPGRFPTTGPTDRLGGAGRVVDHLPTATTIGSLPPRAYLKVLRNSTTSRISRRLRSWPIGGIAEGALTRWAISDWAICRVLVAPGLHHEVGLGLFAQHAGDGLTVLERQRDDAVTRRDAGARLDQRLQQLLTGQSRADTTQVRARVRTPIAERVAAGALGFRRNKK